MKNIKDNNKIKLAIKNKNITHREINIKWPEKESIKNYNFERHIRTCKKSNEHYNFFYNFFFLNESKNRKEFENIKAALSLEKRMEPIIDDNGDDEQTAANALFLCFEDLPEFIFSRIKLSFDMNKVSRYAKKSKSMSNEEKRKLSKIFNHIFKFSEKSFISP